MSIGSILSNVGSGLATAGRVAGAVAGPVIQSLAEEESGQAPEIQAERRRQKMALQQASVANDVNDLQNQLAMGIKYGTLNEDQQGAYKKAIAQKYMDAISQAAAPGGNLTERLHAAVHGGGAPYQPYTAPLASATPEGGTAAIDLSNAEELAGIKATKKQYVSPDGKQRDWFSPGKQPKDWQAVSTGSSSRPVPYYKGALNKANAIDQQNSGRVFQDADGETIDAESLPDGMFILPVFSGNGKEYWQAATDPLRYEVGDNVRRAQPALGPPSPNAPSIGAARVGTITTQASPSGQQVVTGTTTPAAGITRSIPPSTGAQPSTGGQPPRSGAKVGNILPRTPPVGILPDIQHMTPRNAAMAQKAQPAVSALLGLYGDPQNPAVKSMVDFSPLADNKHSQKVLGEAFKLLDQSMGEISDPGIIQTLATKGGWANFRAQAEAQAQQKTGTQMTPDEREYFDTAIASMADIIGSRAATGQSAARFSVRSIQNELPLIGLSGTPDSRSYLTKMQTIGRQVRVGLNGMPDNTRALGWLSKRESDLAQMQSQGTSPSVTPTGVGATTGGIHIDRDANGRIVGVR